MATERLRAVEALAAERMFDIAGNLGKQAVSGAVRFVKYAARELGSGLEDAAEAYLPSASAMTSPVLPGGVVRSGRHRRR